MRVLIVNLLFVVAILMGCNMNNEEISQTVNLDGIDAIDIQHGNANLHLKSTDQPDLVITYEKKYAIEQIGSHLHLATKKNLFRFGPKINLNNKMEISIPDDFNSRFIIHGTSGNITSAELKTVNFEIDEKSGDVQLEFSEFNSDVQIMTSSGDISLNLNTTEPDIELVTKTSSGKQTIVIPIELTKQTNKVMEGYFDKGKYFVELKTISGNITVQ